MSQHTTQPQPGPDLTAALAELTGLMLTTPSMQQLLDQMASAAARVTSPPGSCGITLRRDHQTWTIATSDALASNVDEVQYATEEGPCLESLRTGQEIDVPDLAADSRWGAYRPHALGYGVRSSLSLPLTVEDETRGALNLYAQTTGAFHAAAHQAASMFSDHISTLLTLAARQARQVELSTQLREALASRSVIDQAIGIVMDQQRTGPDQAFTVLRELSQRQNRKLRDVAIDIVTAISGQPLAEPPPFNPPQQPRRSKG